MKLRNHRFGPRARSRARRAPEASIALLLAVAGTLPMAEAQSPTPAPPQPAPAIAAPVTPAVSATDAYSEFKREFDAGQYIAAVPFAVRVLELARQQATSPYAEEVQVALMNLAMTQYLAGDYVGAEDSYLRAIELIESSGRPLHARLARAHAGLAATYHDGNRHDLAVRHFEQAIGLVRRHEGLLTEQQVPLLEKFIDSLTELGRYEEALKAQKYVLRIATRKHGEDDPAVAPALERLGRWYTSVGAYDQARRTLRRAIEIVEDKEGERSTNLIGPLLAIAACNRRQLLDPTQQPLASPDSERSTLFHDPTAGPAMTLSPSALSGEGERALLQAAAIAEERADPSPVQVADVRIQLGDWYQVRAQPERARPHYLQSWQAASRVTEKLDGQPLAEALFGKPVLLHLVRPEYWNRYAQRPPSEIEVRTVKVELTVNALGRAEAIKVIDDSGDPKRGERTAAAAQTARYRPRFENGQAVATSGVVYAQPWVILLEDSAPAESLDTAPADGKD